jgi:hypothetical protein
MPRVAVMACSEAPDECSATIYKNTELDEALVPPVWRGFARVRSYTPYGKGESRWSTQ